MKLFVIDVQLLEKLLKGIANIIFVLNALMPLVASA
jgi:hypothetical protein